MLHNVPHVKAQTLFTISLKQCEQFSKHIQASLLARLWALFTIRTFWDFHSAQCHCHNTLSKSVHDRCNSEQLGLVRFPKLLGGRGTWLTLGTLWGISEGCLLFGGICWGYLEDTWRISEEIWGISGGYICPKTCYLIFSEEGNSCQYMAMFPSNSRPGPQPRSKDCHTAVGGASCDILNCKI